MDDKNFMEDVITYDDIIIDVYMKTIDEWSKWAPWIKEVMNHIKGICEDVIKIPAGKAYLATQIEEIEVPCVVWYDDLDEWNITHVISFLEKTKEVVTDKILSTKITECEAAVTDILNDVMWNRYTGLERGDYDER